MEFELDEDQREFKSLLRTFVDKEIVPVAREWEQAGRYPTEIVDGMKRHGPVRHHRARGVRRARPRPGLLRAGLRGDRARLDGHRRHPRQPLAGLPADRDARHRGAEAEVPARARHRRAPQRHRPHRARRRHRPAGHPHDGAARRRSLRRQRREDVDHQRPLRQPAAGAGQDRPERVARPPRHERAAGRGGHPRLRGHQGHPEARLQGHRVLRDLADRRPRAGLAAGRRRRGPRHAAGAVGAGVGPGQHRRPLGRHRPARLRRGARRTPSSARRSASRSRSSRRSSSSSPSSAPRCRPPG